MELGKIRFIGAEVKSILNFKLEGCVNEHAKAEVRCIVDEIDVNRVIDEVNNHVAVELKEGSETLFAGYLTNADFSFEGHYVEATLTAKGATWLLDVDKKNRSYQDTGMSFEGVVSSKAPCAYFVNDAAIGNILIQFRETDWQFVKRVASKRGNYVFSDPTIDGVMLCCGIDEKKEPVEIESDRYSIERKFPESVLSYEIKCDEAFKVGDAVTFKKQKFYVWKAEINADLAAVEATYVVKEASGFKCKETFLHDIAGASLRGKVIGVEGEKVQVHLDIDEEQDAGGAYWFPFSTLQSSSDGSGWYYMPENGDCVNVCIPTWDEGGAFAVSAVSTYEAEEGAEDMMGDAGSKYMRNPSGNEIKMTSDGVKGSAGAAKFKLGNDGKASFWAQQSLEMEAKSTIQIISDTELEVNAAQTLNMKADPGGQLKMDESGNVWELGLMVNINEED